MATSSNANAALQAQLAALTETTTCGIAEIKKLLEGYEGRLRRLETAEAETRPLIGERIEQITRRVEGQGKAIEKLEELTAKLVNTNNILKWMLGIFATVLVAILLALATGQAQVLFR